MVPKKQAKLDSVVLAALFPGTVFRGNPGGMIESCRPASTCVLANDGSWPSALGGLDSQRPAGILGTNMIIRQAIEAGLAHHRAGQLREAEAIYRQVLQAEPANANAAHLLGLVAYQLGQYSAAAELIGQAIKLEPQVPQFHYNLGEVFRSAARLEDACRAYQQAIACHGDFVEALDNLTAVLIKLGRIDQAIECHRRSAQIRPQGVEGQLNLAALKMHSGEFDQAVGICQQISGGYPTHAKAHVALGAALLKSGRLHQADEACQRAVALDANLAEAHWNWAWVLLGLGQWDRGWAEYEWRWRCWDFPSQRRQFAQPAWDGSDLIGRTILIWAEQGFGDVLQFVRYVALVAQRGGRVVFECQPELHRLLSGIKGVSRVVARGQELGLFDVHLPLLSLPRVFRTTPQTVPADVPYVMAEAELIEKWGARVGPPLGVSRVGLVWSGNVLTDAARACRAQQLTALGGIQGVEFYSFQKDKADPTTSDGAVAAIDFTAELGDFAQTAGLLSHMDLIISVDTAVAHLAGAMGKPVWVMLPFSADWRWLTGRDDTPWYPSMRLFRQSRPGDWQGVVDSVARCLAEWRARRRTIGESAAGAPTGGVGQP